MCVSGYRTPRGTSSFKSSASSHKAWLEGHLAQGCGSEIVRPLDAALGIMARLGVER